MAGRRTLHTEVMVLRKTKLSESDLILTLMAADGEQIRAVAKGARKPGNRFASRLDMFCDSDALIAKGRNLDIVTEASLIDPHVKLREDLDLMAGASALAELGEYTCYENVEDPFVFAILKAAFSTLEGLTGLSQIDLLVAAFTFKVLAHQGWRPELERCTSCGEPDVSFFSARMGGTLCASCAREISGAHELTPQQLGRLKALLTERFSTLMVTPIDKRTARFLFSLAHEWATAHLDTRLRSFEFMRGL